MHLLLQGKTRTQVNIDCPCFYINPADCKKHRTSGGIRDIPFEGGFCCPSDQAALTFLPALLLSTFIIVYTGIDNLLTILKVTILCREMPRSIRYTHLRRKSCAIGSGRCVLFWTIIVKYP